MEFKHAVINIMDKEINSAVYSQNELPITDQVVQEYVKKIVEKFLKSECITFDCGQSQPVQYLASQEESLVIRAQNLTQHVFDNKSGRKPPTSVGGLAR